MLLLALATTWGVGSGIAAPLERDATAKKVRRLFAQPTREYSTAVPWTWSPQLTEGALRETLRQLAGQGVKQAVVNPEPFLSATGREAFPFWKIALREASRLDMDLWLWLGTAAGNSELFNPGVALNVLTPGTTDKFLEALLDPYDQELAEAYGDRIPALLLAMPGLEIEHGVPWSAEMPEVFKRRWGYELSPLLPALTRQVGDWQRVRHNYAATLQDLLVERWARPAYEACDRRDIRLTGDFPAVFRDSDIPDAMAMTGWQQWPGGTTRPLAPAREVPDDSELQAAREIASIANQRGRLRTTARVEAPDDGWGRRFVDMKRRVDGLQVLGINTVIEPFDVSRIPANQPGTTFSNEDAWWQAYHIHASYASRLSAALSQGVQRNRILVVQPTTTAWMYRGDKDRLRVLDTGFSNFLEALEAAQVEYDVGSESMMTTEGGLGGDAIVGGGWFATSTLRVGERAYQVVVLPPGMENMNRSTRDLLKTYQVSGGMILSCGPPPARTDGQADPQAGQLANSNRGWSQQEPPVVVETLRALMKKGDLAIRPSEESAGHLRHHRREWTDGQLVFLVNSSTRHPARGEIQSRRQAIEEWNPSTGETRPYRSQRTKTGLIASLELPPCGSLLLFLTDEELPTAAPSAGATRLLHHSGVVRARQVGPGSLTCTETFDVREKAERVAVQLPEWYGAVAKVVVNGRDGGWIVSPPWECDVTERVRRGRNTIEVTIIGTREVGPKWNSEDSPATSEWQATFQESASPGPSGGAPVIVTNGFFRPFVLKLTDPPRRPGRFSPPDRAAADVVIVPSPG